ncbi:diaminopropionate ammonia-lyase [Streptomyces kanamyceticus]|uniref:diaminopropionate ammonia-lyase n=1 Tax=Streptomyces kanamyceticus TaxID=1967 RepID=UPI0037DDC5AB
MMEHETSPVADSPAFPSSSSARSSLPRPPWFARPAARSWTCAPPPADAHAFHAALPGYTPTALHEPPTLAAELGVARVFVKDESERLGLPAFKALGASWAIHRVLAAASDDRRLCLVTATDGNHGRAVAKMARQLGLRAHVFVPEGVHPAAAAAIAGEGAEVTTVAGSYDAAVRRAADAAGAPDAVLIQDMAWDGYEEVPALIVEGYATLFSEVDAQLAAAGAPSPSLVVVPVGVGSLAQAAVAHYRSRRSVTTAAGEAPAALLSVEPEVAACVLGSLRAGRPTSVETGVTTMAGLNCGTPSTLAWPALRDGLDAAIAIRDADSAAAMRDLADLGVSSGPCGAASLAGARAALTGEGSAGRRAALDIGAASTVVLISTEGAAAATPSEAPQAREDPV